MSDQATIEPGEKDMSKRGGPMTTETVNVSVIPKIVQGNNVYCEITRGQGTGENRVKGGVIKLPPDATYTLNFSLQSGDVSNLTWSTDQNGGCNGFWSSGNSCPTGSGQDEQVTGNPSANGNTVSLTITPDSGLGRNVVHYALNFDQGTTALQCDPIIVVG